MKANDLPNNGGTYILWLNLAGPARIVVGRLGTFDFPAGDYVYVGSAHGPGGLRARLGHHLKPGLKPHWHIDYLRQQAQINGLGFAIMDETRECLWSRRISIQPEVSTPAPGFGASDCHAGCMAHLYRFAQQLNLRLLSSFINEPWAIWLDLSKIE